MVYWRGVHIKSRVVMTNLGVTISLSWREEEAHMGSFLPNVVELGYDMILRRLRDLGFKALAYADDLVVIVSDTGRQTISNILKRTLCKVGG